MKQTVHVSYLWARLARLHSVIVFLFRVLTAFILVAVELIVKTEMLGVGL